MKLLALVLFGLPLAAATIVEASRGNTFAIALGLAALGPILFVATAAVLMRAMAPALPRKADYAKIARMERELGIGPAWEWKAKRASEIETTLAEPPAERNVDDCPRPESCVIAHPCRKCGADRGQACARVHLGDFTPAERRAIDLADAAGLSGDARRKLIADYLEGYAQGLAEEAPTTVAMRP